MTKAAILVDGYRGEDAKDKKATMDTRWVPGANHHGQYGRWAFAEFTDVFGIDKGFHTLIDELIGTNAPA